MKKVYFSIIGLLLATLILFTLAGCTSSRVKQRLSYILADNSYAVTDIITSGETKLLFIRNRFLPDSKLFLVLIDKNENIRYFDSFQPDQDSVWYPQLLTYTYPNMIKITHENGDAPLILDIKNARVIENPPSYEWENIDYDVTSQNDLNYYTDLLRSYCRLKKQSNLDLISSIASHFPFSIKQIARTGNYKAFYLQHRFNSYKLLVVTNEKLEIINYHELPGNRYNPGRYVYNDSFLVIAGFLIYNVEENSFKRINSRTSSHWIWNLTLEEDQLYYRTEKNIHFTYAKIDLADSVFSKIEWKEFSKATGSQKKEPVEFESTAADELTGRIAAQKKELEHFAYYKKNLITAQIIRLPAGSAVIYREKEKIAGKTYYLFFDNKGSLLKIITFDNHRPSSYNAYTSNGSVFVLNIPDCPPSLFDGQKLTYTFLPIKTTNIFYMGLDGNTLYCSSGSSRNFHVYNIETKDYYYYFHDRMTLLASPFYKYKENIYVVNEFFRKVYQMNRYTKQNMKQLGYLTAVDIDMNDVEMLNKPWPTPSKQEIKKYNRLLQELIKN